MIFSILFLLFSGALVTGFLASGMNPKDMPEKVFQIKRANIWDVGLGIGLLKGKKFQKILENNFTCKYIEDCVIPYGCTAYDVLGCRTNCITTGHIATAVRASCTFPCLFQPVVIDNRYSRMDLCLCIFLYVFVFIL